MKFSDKILSQTVTQLCLAKGIEHIVISPGSRNAPLTIGFTEVETFTNYSIVDERCAAFFALGIAQQIKKPVALVCTSGSALLNYYPAVAEAYYSDIPLIIISADRPASHIEIGDGQTIQQEQVFGNHVLFHANCKEGDAHQTFNETEINSALNKALVENGPVHINLPFSEPLYNKTMEASVIPTVIPLMEKDVLKGIELETAMEPFIDPWNQSKRKLILVGVLAPNSVEKQLIEKLAKDKSVIVLTETTSNIHHDQFFPAIDQLIAPLNEAEFEQLQPDVLLTFGGMVVSKKIKAFLRAYPPKVHWHVDPKKAYDTYFVLDKHIQSTPNAFLQFLLENPTAVASSFHEDWQAVRRHRLQRHESYLNEIEFSDFKVFAEVFSTLPENIQIQLSNSATIRYAQLFDIHESIEVFCNRGTSGIDGSMSTAIGATVGSKKSTTFITGDLSFFYDSNALWNNYTPKSFKIIVINNGGGGIFRILKGAKETEHFDTYFETKHQLTAEKLCEMHGLEYTSVTEEHALRSSLSLFFSRNKGPQLLEIFTPSEVNDKILLDYFKFIR